MGNLREILTDIYEKHGEITPKIVVEEARPHDSLLHHRFEWDDSVAGEAYRRVQAGGLLREVMVRLPDSPNGEHKFVRAFHSRREAGDKIATGYMPTVEIVQDPLMTRLLLKEFEREIVEIKRKYGHLTEFAQIMNRAAS